MKIGDRIVPSRGPRSYGTRLPAGNRASERRLSAAKLLATLSQCRDWAPDPQREARIGTLRQAVKSGTYRIDYQQTARAMLGEISGEALA
jgi:anti-sigma28 factor (negative regulator of flagellin synthesis)